MSALWRITAFLFSRRWIARRLIARAQRTPYFHLPGYMGRWWLFNGYAKSEGSETDEQRQKRKRWPRMPSIRVHHILRADAAEHPHDHPWDARTIILDGWYRELRLDKGGPLVDGESWTEVYTERLRRCGDTAVIKFGQYHHIAEVSPGGVWTIFIVGRYRGNWGFLRKGKKVPPAEYVASYPQRDVSLPPKLAAARAARPGA